MYSRQAPYELPISHIAAISVWLLFFRQMRPFGITTGNTCFLEA